MLDWDVFRWKFDSWAHKIEPFFITGQMDKIYDVLKYDARRGIERSPAKNNTFKAFEYCNLRDLKCIFLGLAPYASFSKIDGNYVPVSDGLAFSCSITNIEQPSLTTMWDAVFDNYKEEGKRYTNLSHWAAQGVLLLNIALTARKNQPESDVLLWEPFMHFLFEEVLNTERGIPIVYFGKEAGKWEKYSTPFIHYNKIIEHPAYAARQQRMLKHENIFTWINVLLKEQGKEQIKWICTQEEYDSFNSTLECPF